ncbi:MAG: flavodoxin family protein [Phocaeicola sp.]
MAGKNIGFCKGCLACQKLGKCIINDDVNDIMQKVLNADVVCWATPIYYYEMSGQMKVLIDRLNALFALDYKFHVLVYHRSRRRGGNTEAGRGGADGLD